MQLTIKVAIRVDVVAHLPEKLLVPAPAAALLVDPAGTVAEAGQVGMVDPAGMVAKVGQVGMGKVAGIAELWEEKLSCACYP